MVHQKQQRADFGVIGLGRFGRLLAAHLGTRGSVLGWDGAWKHVQDAPPDIPDGLRPALLPEVCSARVVIYAVPIGALPAAMASTRDLLRPPTLVADTASVKVWPCRWLLEHLPPWTEILGTHPLFGPDSAASGLDGHKIAVVPVRTRHLRSVRRFLEELGLQVLVTDADTHDRQMAETQSVVHWLGRALERTGAHTREIDTLGYRRLLEILEYVTRDSWELFRDLQRWNPHSVRIRRRFLEALAELDQEIDPGRDQGPPS